MSNMMPDKYQFAFAAFFDQVCQFSLVIPYITILLFHIVEAGYGLS